MLFRLFFLCWVPLDGILGCCYCCSIKSSLPKNIPNTVQTDDKCVTIHRILWEKGGSYSYYRIQAKNRPRAGTLAGCRQESIKIGDKYSKPAFHRGQKSDVPPYLRAGARKGVFRRVQQTRADFALRSVSIRRGHETLLRLCVHGRNTACSVVLADASALAILLCTRLSSNEHAAHYMA